MSSAGGRRTLPAAAVHSLKGPGDVYGLRRLGRAFRRQLAPSVLLASHALCRVGLGHDDATRCRLRGHKVVGKLIATQLL